MRMGFAEENSPATRNAHERITTNKGRHQSVASLGHHMQQAFISSP